MYNTNFDQLYAYLSQHEAHANEARMMRERYLDPLVLVANHQTQSNSIQYPQQLSSIHQSAHSSQPYLPTCKDNGRIIFNSVKNGPLVWPTVALENGIVRSKTYEELSNKEKLQADYDLKATNIVLQGLPLDVYALVNHHKVSKDIWDRVKLLMQGTYIWDRLKPALCARPKLYKANHTQPFVTQNAYPPSIIPQQPQAEFPQIDLALAVPTFLPSDDPIAYLLPIRGIKPPLKMIESPFSKFKEDKVKMLSVQVHKGILQVQGEIHQVKQRLSSVIIDKVKRVKNCGNVSKFFKQRCNVVLSDLEKLIDSQMVDLIRTIQRKENLISYGQRDSVFGKHKIKNWNTLSTKDFEKCFVLQQELSAEQKIWLQSSDKNPEEPSTSKTPVKIKVPSELPKVSLVNKSLKKLRFHLASFAKVVKVRTTPDAVIEGL
ncbi:hypothetical protein Tco_0958094 [Tanacetum coccineum]